MGVSGHLTSRPFKSPLCLFDKGLGGPQNPSGRCGVEKNLYPDRNPTRLFGCPARCLITVPTELPRILPH
jgi:hypothetical protein